MIAAGRVRFADVVGRADPDGVALIGAGRGVTYGELASRMARRAEELELAERSLVVLSGSRSTEFVVTYLALLDAGHVPLLAGSHVERLVDHWRPAAVVDVRGDAVDVDRRRGESPELHPDLRLLLSTSGSTGAPKLVRLSDRNLLSNAEAIVEFLGLTPDDRGITTLPLHYCYGLSVLHSHLAAGASVVLTEASVVDPCFAADLGDHGVTNVAGVPHTFDLLERAGPERLRVPTLRLITQAGGRLAPERVERWLHRADEWEAEFYVMYGQTEATARMAYLPPAIARRRPGSIGVPIPGGSIEVRPVDGLPDGVGELVYRGPNVMLGYAIGDADLAAGASSAELPTGDVGRYHADDGVFEIVGRRARFVKPFGTRVDLDVVEQDLGRALDEVAVTGDDEQLVVIAPGATPASVRRAVCERTGLPESVVVVDPVGPVPRTAAGKIDYEAARRQGAALRATSGERDRDHRETSIAQIYAEVLGCPSVDRASSFVTLGGDSLSYVECSLRIERLLGHVPGDWHVRPISELEAIVHRRRLPRLDTTVVLRAIGICAVVATHMGLVFFPGGAHLLLAVAGFNLGRFQLPIAAAADRIRAGLRTVARAAIPTVLWVAVGMLLLGRYSLGTLALVNNYVGPRSHRDDHWHFWFIEVFVHLTLATTLLLAVPAVRRLERRFPYGLPMALFAACLVLRLEWAQLGDWYNLRYRTHGVAWFFVLGWLVQRSTATWQRLLTSALCLLTIPGFFDRPQREWFIAVGLVVLVWCRDVPFPRAAMRPVAAVASASMWILITHFTVWPPLDRELDRRLAYVVTILFGVLAWYLAERLVRATRRLVASRRAAGRAGHATPARRLVPAAVPG